MVAFSQLFIGTMVLSIGSVAKEQKPLWSVELELHAPCLKPEVVQFAVFENDPVPEYIKRVKEVHKRLSQKKVRPVEEKINIENRIIKIAWNKGFEKVKGDEVHLLEGFELKILKEDTVMTEEGEKIAVTVKGKSTVICGDDIGKKWIVTKAQEDTLGVLRCWCIPIECGLGESIRQKLTLENAFDLYKKYREVIGEK